MRLVYDKVNYMQNPYQTWDAQKRKYIQKRARITVISSVEWGVEMQVHEFEFQRWDGITRVVDHAIESDK